ncbi:MAG TPA: hypothetical protein VGI11_00985 [Variovorax sp.]|jgi:hypothetical protein
MIRIHIHAAVGGVLLASALGASAQSHTDLAHAHERFERQVAHCNSGKLPAPEREACIRRAGAALDKARGGPPSTVTRRTADGRSTAVVPEGAPVPSGGSGTARSADGRSTIVLPANQSAPAHQP